MARTPLDDVNAERFVDLEKGLSRPINRPDNGAGSADRPVLSAASTAYDVDAMQQSTAVSIATPDLRDVHSSFINPAEMHAGVPRRGCVEALCRAGASALPEFDVRAQHQVHDLAYGALVGACRGLILSGGLASYLASYTGRDALGWALCAGLTAKFMVSDAKYYREIGEFLRRKQTP